MKIHKVKPDITWEEFKEKFGKKFKVSNEAKRTELVKAEFTRLTGRNPEDDGKVKRFKQPTGRTDSRGDGEKDTESGKGSRKRGDKPEHGSAIPGKGLFGKESTDL